jgi:hypothetical protein
LSHLLSKQDYEQIFQKWQESKSGVLTAFLTEKALARCKDIEHWMKMAVIEEQPCDIVEQLPC